MPDFLSDIVVNVVLTTPLVGAYTMFAIGIVFIYQASKVLNLAHGAMAMFPAYIAFSLAGPLGVVGATIGALAVGAALGVVVERTVVKRLREGSATAQTVGTAAVLGLLIALVVRIWGTSPLNAPSLFPDTRFKVGNSALELNDVVLFVAALGLSALFLGLLKYTRLGLAMRCAADNRNAAWLMGIDPERTTMMAWMFAGLLAALGGLLLAASTILHPFTLSLQVLPAFVAALIGGLVSVPGAVVGSVVVGLTLGIVPTLGGIGEQVGAPQVALGVLAFVVMSLRGARFSVAQSSSTAL